MNNVLFIYENEIPTVSITRNFWGNISKEYGILSKFIMLSDVQSSDIDWCDVLVMIRPNNVYAWRIAALSRKSGCFIITTCDDDLLHLPKTHPDLYWRRKGLIKALNNSNVFMTTSRHLMEQMLGYTIDKRGVYVDTVVKYGELLERDYETEKRDMVRFVYAAGGGQHEVLFEQIVLPALRKAAACYPGKFSLTFISVHPNCEGLEKSIPITYIEGMPFLEYRKFMDEQKFDVGIAPLEDSPFAKCKYFNKYLEYTLSGVVGVYSNVEPYTYVVTDGDNGYLADNNDISWEEKLKIAIEDSSLRIACARNAQKHVRDNFNEQVLMERLLSEVPELYKKTGERNPCRNFSHWRIYYRFLKCVEYIFKSFFYMKNEGMNSVVKRAVARLKRS